MSISAIPIQRALSLLEERHAFSDRELREAGQAACAELLHQVEAARRAVHRYSPAPAIAPQGLWKEYEQSLEQARLQRQHAWGSYRDAASRERRRLKEKYRNQRGLLAALPMSSRDRKRLSQQLALRQAIESRALKRKLAVQRRAIQKPAHPGTWRHFVASRAAHRDARAIRLLRRRERERGGSDQEREL